MQGFRVWSSVLVTCVVLAGCGGSEENAGDEVRSKAKTALRTVEPDLERLARAVTAAEADDKSSLVEVQAAAQRASEALGDARRELRDLTETDDIDETARRELTRQAGSVRDLQELADVLAQPKLSSPRIDAALAVARIAAEDLTVIDVPAINANLLAEDLRKVRAASQRRRNENAAARKRAAQNNAQTGQPSAPVGSSGGGSSGSFSYTTYNGPAFQARIPTGAGWGSPSSSQPTPGQLFRTNVRGPNGLFVIIDFTPYETAKFGGSYSSRTVVGQTAFGSAVRYEFQGGSIPECQRSRCVDYIINDPATGQGFAVLAGGGTGSADIARTVAESVVPTFGE